MVFVWLSHFCGAYLYPNGRTPEADLLVGMSMIASPSFVLISGIVCGFLATMHPANFPRLKRHLLDRGAFLLIVGHLVLAVSVLPRNHDLGVAYANGFVTDAIAVAIMFGPQLVDTMTGRWRLLLAVTLFSMNWLLVANWQPFGIGGQFVKRYIIGDLAAGTHPAAIGVFPILPWFAVYLAGTVIGEHLGRHYRNGALERARALLRRVAVASVLAGLAAYIGDRELGIHGLAWMRDPAVAEFATPTQKFPPGCAYVLFFGGAGLLVAWMMLEIEARQWLPWLTEFLRNLGHASLLVYLVQAYLSTMLRQLGLPYSAAWPLLYLSTLSVLGLTAAAWCRIDGNRFFTVGLRLLLDRRARPPRFPLAA